jgi:hypothetical protein
MVGRCLELYRYNVTNLSCVVRDVRDCVRLDDMPASVRLLAGLADFLRLLTAS